MLIRESFVREFINADLAKLITT